MSDTAVSENAAKAVKHAGKAAVEPVKDVLVEVGKAKWFTPKTMLVAGVTVLVAGTALVAVQKVRAIKAAKQAAADEEA